MLNRRIVQATEEKHLRTQAQAGFCPHLSTLHPLFALQHIIDRSKQLKTPLYCCFLDLKAAYDSVDRNLLWDVLQRLGIHCLMLSAIQSLYVGCHLAMKVGRRKGEALHSQTGVKQGCPLSPTLFGLFLDGLHSYISEQCPELGAPISDCMKVTDLQ